MIARIEVLPPGHRMGKRFARTGAEKQYTCMKRFIVLLLSGAALSLSACCHTMNAAVAETMCCHDKCCEKECVGDKCPCGKCPSRTKIKLATALLPI